MKTSVDAVNREDDRFAAAPAQGKIWWAELGEARGSKPAFRRPVVVVQGDLIKRAGKLPESKLELLLVGIDVLLDR